MGPDDTSAGFDLEFPPASYFVRRDVTSAIVQQVKGDRRRAMVRNALGDGREVAPELRGAEAPRDLQERLERLNPRWMGGEYLPECEEGEDEIARLILASATRDVYSVRAGSITEDFRYRVVDEYDTDWCLTRETSRSPLSVRELVELIDGATFLDNEWSDLTNSLRDGALCG